jgi:hypothetical protein
MANAVKRSREVKFAMWPGANIINYRVFHVIYQSLLSSKENFKIYRNIHRCFLCTKKSVIYISNIGPRGQCFDCPVNKFYSRGFSSSLYIILE